MQQLTIHLNALRGRRFSPAAAIGIAAAAGLVAASLVTLLLEALFLVHWWTIVVYMVAFFVTGVVAYKRLSPDGAKLATDGGLRYLEDSGTLDLVEAAKELARSR